MKKKVLLTSIATIALCLCLIAGSTFALFTSTSEIDISVKAAKVEMTASITDLKLESVQADPNGKIEDEFGGKYSYVERKDTFINGGTAELVGSILSLEKVTPGDKVSFNVKGKNTSDVTIQYRYVIECVKGLDALAEGLIVSINGVEYNCLKSYTSTWMTLTPGNDITPVPVVIELPVNAGNKYQSKSAEIRIAVEAVQGNAATTDTSKIDLAVSSADMLAKALKSDIKNIAVTLANDIDLPIRSLGQQTGGSGEYKIGGENTETIDIDLNGYKLNITTDYWSGIGAKNDNAIITVKNGSMTSSQAKGTWNSYDLTFANCNWVFENVTFDKAIALTNAGKTATLNNVTINETHDYYALWISAKGQTVNIDGLTVNSDGRGIKIDDQYVDAPAKVTLSVSNAKFDTAKKAAIMVKSAAGAKITLSNVDITNTPDPVHAVWVDSDNQHGDLVEVNPADSKYNESDVVSGQENLDKAIANGGLVVVAPGNYTFPSGIKAGTTLVCGEDTVFEGTSKLNINGATVVGATFSNPTGSIVYHATINGVFKNCTFTGYNGLRYAYAGETVVFENCTFDGSVYGIHFDGGANDVLFKGCTFSGFNAMGGAVTKLVMEDCTFQATGRSGYNGINLWGDTDMINCTFVFDGTTSYEWVDLCNDNKTVTFTNCVVTDGENEKDIKTVIGNFGTGNSITVDGEEIAIASNKAGLDEALSNGASEIYLGSGDYSMPEPDLRGKTLTINGTKDTVIDVSKVDARDQFVTGSTIVFDGVTLNFGYDNYMGFANTETLIYRNCHITGLQFLYGETVIFENCVIDSSANTKEPHAIWTYGAKNITFTDCDFIYGNRAINCYKDQDIDGGKQVVNFNNCTFTTTDANSEGAVEINSSAFSVGIEVNMEGCTAPATGSMAYVSKWDSTNGAKTTINIK